MNTTFYPKFSVPSSYSFPITNISISIPTLKNITLTTNNQLIHHRQKEIKEKVVVVMGATGTGKSKFSIDLARRFGGEAINSDKMQVYQGLDIITNKITDEESCGVPHHLIGEIIDPELDFSAANFCTRANKLLNSIISRRHLPIIVGGSNSFIEALVDDSDFLSRFDCCFLWVHVEMPELHSFVSDRVNKMVKRGLVEEARDYYNPKGDYSGGIRRAIGVPELDRYFRDETSFEELTRAIDQIKANTSKLARRQLEKIKRLNRTKGWGIHQLDATDVFRRRGAEAEEVWEELVGRPGADVVRRFLHRRQGAEAEEAWKELVGRPGADLEPVVYGRMMGVRMAGAPPLMVEATAAFR